MKECVFNCIIEGTSVCDKYESCDECKFNKKCSSCWNLINNGTCSSTKYQNYYGDK